MATHQRVERVLTVTDCTLRWFLSQDTRRASGLLVATSQQRTQQGMYTHTRRKHAGSDESSKEMYAEIQEKTWTGQPLRFIQGQRGAPKGA